MGRQSAPALAETTTNNYADLSQPSKPISCNSRMIDRSTAAVSLEAEYNLPAQLLFDLLSDPARHTSFFKSIESVDAVLLEEIGPKRKWQLDYQARWRFWKVSGVCENRMYLLTDSKARTVAFKLREPGFLRKYEGTWTITPTAAAAAVNLSSSSSSSSSSIDLQIPNAVHSSSHMQPVLASIRPAGAAAATGSSSSSFRLPVDLGFLGAVVERSATLLSWRQQQQQRDLDVSLHDQDLGSSSSSSGSEQYASAPAAAAAAAVIRLNSITSPCRCPPYPLNVLLKQQCQGQAQEMLDGLVAAAAAAATVATEAAVLDVQPLKLNVNNNGWQPKLHVMQQQQQQRQLVVSRYCQGPIAGPS